MSGPSIRRQASPVLGVRTNTTWASPSVTSSVPESRWTRKLFKTLDRSGASAGFTNPNLGNSRVGLGVRVENADDGDGVLAFIGQPFLCAGCASRLERHRDRVRVPATFVRRGR